MPKKTMPENMTVAEQNRYRRSLIRSETNRESALAVWAKRRSETALIGAEEGAIVPKKVGRPKKVVFAENQQRNDQIGVKKEVIHVPHPTRGMVPAVVLRSSEGRTLRSLISKRTIPQECESSCMSFEKDYRRAYEGGLKGQSMVPGVDGSAPRSQDAVTLQAGQRLSAVRQSLGDRRFMLAVQVIIHGRSAEDFVRAGADGRSIRAEIRTTILDLAESYGLRNATVQRRRNLLGITLSKEGGE